MNLLTIAYKSIRQRALASSLTALSVALGVMLMVAVLVIHGVVDRMFSQRSIGYHLIVGPKGSPMQLVLNTVFRLQQPIENLPYDFYLELKRKADVEGSLITEAIPFALGDVTEEGAFPIVGTVSRYFELPFSPGRTFRIRGHKLSGPFQAVIGSRVARDNGWDIDTQFSLIHGGMETGHIHDEKFTVVAVLARTGTPNDKTVFVNLDGFYMIQGHDKPLDEAVKRWLDFNGKPADEDAVNAEIKRLNIEPHEEEEDDDGEHFHEIPDIQKEVTAILLLMKSDSAAFHFMNQMKEGFKAQAVNPIEQMQFLMQVIVGNVQQMLVVMTALIIAVSGVSIFVSIYNSMADRKREIAIMRALGAQRTTVFSIILAESMLLCFGGGLLGMLMGHGLVFIAAPVVEAKSGVLIDPLAFEMTELYILPVMIALASLVGFIPGMTAYRTDVAQTLAD